jgi:hypothetical protein
MKPRHFFLAAGVIGAAWLAWTGNKTPVDVVEPVARAAVPERSSISIASAAVAAKRPDGEIVILALRPRDELLGASKVDAASDTLFRSQSWVPPPPPPAPPPPPPPPMAPPMPFSYVGKKTDGAVWEIYLARGDQTYIVHADDVIEGTYRVETIAPPTMTLVYLPLKQQQTLHIGGTD